MVIKRLPNEGVGDDVRDAVGGVVEVDEGEVFEVRVPSKGDAVGRVVGALEAG